MLYVFIQGRPAEPESHIQPSSGTSRAKLLLDGLGTVTNMQKTLESGSKVGVEATDVVSGMLTDDIRQITGHANNGVGEGAQAVGKAATSITTATGDVAEQAVKFFAVIPAVLTKSLQSVVTMN